MEDQVKKLKELIETSSKILITSHISPDPDAVSSLLLAGTALKKNFSDKQIAMVLEEEPIGLEFLAGYKEIEFGPLNTALAEYTPDLIILVDANNYDRASRLSGDKVRGYISQNHVKTVIIDHHEPVGKDNADVYINQDSPATAQDVYEVLFDYLGLEKPAGFAQATMLGLYSDTGGFAYENPRHSATFKLADELIDAGANIEEINNLSQQYTDGDIKVLAELAGNATHQVDYSYSFISDEFVGEWLRDGRNGAELHRGTGIFVNDFIRNIGGRRWGFIVYKNVLAGDNIYSVSFRSVGNTKDVSGIAASLGGGGHKPAAGAKFEASSVQDAVSKVESAIKAKD